jgi:hypothetical protein
MSKRKSVFRKSAHNFIFRTARNDKMKVPTKVRLSNKEVLIGMKTEDILRSISLNGQADTQNCPGALCTVREKDKFDHGVCGFTDWWPSRCFIGSKKNKDGTPTECVQYETDGKIDELVDSTPDGLQRLLKKCEAAGGVIVIRLKACRDHSNQPGKPIKPTGKLRKRREKMSGIGHEYRFSRLISGAFSSKAP